MRSNLNILPSIPQAPSQVQAEGESIFSFTKDKLSRHIQSRFDESQYRGQQLFEWIYRRHEFDPKKMSNISRKFRTLLADEFSFALPKIRERLISVDGTRKYLLEVDNGDLVEAVMIKQPSRMTLCVSSQVGCAIGCKFCRTGTMGLKRNLGVHEIIGQVMAVIKDAKNFDDMFSNVVFMGMGEPLHNYKNVTDALRIMRDPSGLALSARKITISTAGLVPAIKKFGGDDIDACLAVSLNATTDETRSKIMPINMRYSISTLIAALKEYPLRKREQITIEYVMLKGVNDSLADLRRLPKLLKGLSAKINLIPYNFNSGLGFESCDRELPRAWQKELNQKGMLATIRWSKGPDIGAACGQLVTDSKRETRIKKPQPTAG